jgi:hypothetical protein
MWCTSLGVIVVAFGLALMNLQLAKQTVSLYGRPSIPTGPFWTVSSAGHCAVTLSNMRLSGRAVNKVRDLSSSSTGAMMRCRAAQLWR